MQREEEVVYLYLDDIIPNRFQPREIFEERPLKELAISIKEHGVIQPIIVRKVNDKYEIIAGERRYKASALAGLTKIPAIIRNLDDKESSKVALLENLQRRNLNPIEEARTYQKILEIDEMTQEELAKTMGKSQSAVANKIRLLSLPEEIQKALLDEKISERHARTLLNVKDPKEQQKLLNEVIENKMTVRQLEEKIKGEQAPMVNTIQDISLSGQQNVEELKPENNQNIAGQDNYLSNSPLMPSFITGDQEESKNEPLLINQSGEDLTSSQKNEPLLNIDTQDDTDNNKFINFGEIDKDSPREELNDSFNENDSLPFEKSDNSHINIEDIEKNSSDISLNNDNTGSADLDSLLQINPTTTNTSDSNSDFKFFSSAQEAVNDSDLDDSKSSGDYFKAPELINVDMPGEATPISTNSVNLGQANYDMANENKSTPTINFGNREDVVQDAVNLLRDAIKKIEANGLKVDSDEMNMEKSYQIIIKIEK